MLKIYLAGKYGDYKQIHEKMQALKKLGHFITFDWTQNVENRAQNPTTFDKAKSAADDIKGVRDCDLLIVLLTDPNYAYNGTHTEFGAGLALQKKIYVVCPPEASRFKQNVFLQSHGLEHFESWEAVINQLTSLSQ